MASTVWKGYLTFGLISIPIKLYAAARSERVSFHMVHEPCNTRVKQQLYCPTCRRVVERSELVKGYELDKNRIVTVKDEELKKIAPPSSDTMEILQFVKLAEVDPIYFDTSYFALPEEPGRKAYQLLVETMEKAGYAALAKVAMHQREYTVLIRPRDHGLTVHTIHYADEVREVPGYGEKSDVELKPQELQLAKQLVDALAAPFDPKKFEDQYQKNVLQLIQAKMEGKGVKETPAKKLAPVINLMEALQKSLATTAEKKPAAKTTAARRGASSAPRRKAAGR